MKKLIISLVGIAAGLSAQEAFQVQAPQVYEYRNGVLVGSSYLGVNLAEIDAARAHELNLKETYGVEITRVEEGSPADKAGLKPKDVVLEYNGQRVEGMEQFGRLVRETPAGREVKLQISRNGAPQTIAATIATRKMKAIGENFKDFFPNGDWPAVRLPDMPQVFTTFRSGILGVESEALGSQLGAFFGVKEGVLVRSVVKDSPADKAGIKAGDVLTKVDGTSVASPNELSGAVRSAASKKTYTVDLMRDRKEMSLTVTNEEPERSVPRGRVIRNIKML